MKATARLGLVVWVVAGAGTPASTAQESARSPAQAVTGRIVNAAPETRDRAVVSRHADQTTTDGRGAFASARTPLGRFWSNVGFRPSR
jgi:hypothetical protein